MRARATARLLIVAIAAALAVGSAAQPRLVPPEEPNGAIPAAYQRDVRQVFAEAHGADVVLRAIVLPGLGVAILDRRGARDGGGVRVIETEAAHIGFCPLDPEEEELSDALTARYGRASVERVVSGPGLIDIYRFLGGGDWDPNKAGALWDAAVDGGDPLAERALSILVRCLGAAAGDIALAHGAMGVAITGALAGRIADLLKTPMFEARFTAKGRYRARMLRTPVKLLAYAEPGLLGAAIAFEREWGA